MTLLLKNLLFTVLVPGTVGVYVPLRLTHVASFAEGLTLVLAVALLALGAMIYAWCVWDFAMFGRGTPAPVDAPKRLVVRGLYRCVRNPMYVGVLTVILGWAVLFQSPRVLIYGIAVGVCFHLFVVLSTRSAVSPTCSGPNIVITVPPLVDGCRGFPVVTGSENERPMLAALPPVLAS